jgi:hypothetical protein
VISAPQSVSFYRQKADSPKKAANDDVFGLPQRVIKSVDFSPMRAWCVLGRLQPGFQQTQWVTRKFISAG